MEIGRTEQRAQIAWRLDARAKEYELTAASLRRAAAKYRGNDGGPLATENPPSSSAGGVQRLHTAGLQRGSSCLAVVSK
jgi:hypothetical protein